MCDALRMSNLDAVVTRLVERCAPDRIILFGSHAAGTARADSDVDLLIVTETTLGPIERRVQVERMLADRTVVLDLHVYTPAEMRRLYAWGDPFIEEVVERGRVVYMRRATAAWLRDAREDLAAAEILLAHDKRRAACFHSQQSVEKALKALLLERGTRPPRTHDIVDLANLVAAQGWSVRLETALLPSGDPDPDDTARAVAAARALLEEVSRLLPGMAEDPTTR